MAPQQLMGNISSVSIMGRCAYTGAGQAKGRGQTTAHIAACSAHLGALDADAHGAEGAAVHDVLQAALVAELQQEPGLLELLPLRLLTVRNTPF